MAPYGLYNNLPPHLHLMAPYGLSSGLPPHLHLMAVCVSQVVDRSTLNSERSSSLLKVRLWLESSTIVLLRPILLSWRWYIFSSMLPAVGRIRGHRRGGTYERAHLAELAMVHLLLDAACGWKGWRLPQGQYK